MATFYTVNDFALDADVQLNDIKVCGPKRFTHGGRYKESEQYPALTNPVIKALNTVEVQCEKALSAIPSVNIIVSIGVLNMSDPPLDRNVEEPVAHIMRTLLGLNEAYAANDWDLDMVLRAEVLLPVHPSVKVLDNSKTRMPIKDGHACLEELVQDMARRRQSRRESSLHFNDIDHHLEVLRRWQQIFDALRYSKLK
jgi:hypothetical protein